MLQAMRTGAQSILMKGVLFGLLLLAMGGLAVMDVQGMFRGGVQRDTLAKMAGEKISTADFNRTLEVLLRQRNISEDDAYRMGLPRQLLEQDISSRVFSRAAFDAGLLTDDATAAEEIRRLIEPLVKQGLSDKDALERFLRSFGASEAKLVYDIKRQIATDTFVRLLSEGARAPRQMVVDALKFKNEARRGEYFTLTLADAQKVHAPSEKELKDHYKMISRNFMLPEYRSFAVLVLDKKSLGVEEEGLYDKANAIDDMIAGGKPLSDIAEEYNLKPKTFDRLTAQDKAAGAGIPAFDKILAAVFSLNQGEASQLIETPDGGFIFAELREIVPAEARPFDKVRGDVESDWTAFQKNRLLNDEGAAILAMLKDKPFEKVAASVKKAVDRTELVQRGSPGDLDMTENLFSIPVLGQATTFRRGEALIVLRLSERKIDKKDPSKEDMAAFQSYLDRALQNDILEQYRQGLFEKYSVTINDELLSRVYAPKSREE